MPFTYSNKVDNLTSQTVRPFSRRLDTVGDGSGLNNAIGAYTLGAPGVFKIVGGAGVLVFIKRLIVYIADDANISGTGYGGNGVLPNGLLMEIVQGGETVSFSPNPITTNAQWQRIAGSNSLIQLPGQANSIAFALEFNEQFVPLAIGPGIEFRITCRDDLSFLTEHAFTVQGFRFVA